MKMSYTLGYQVHSRRGGDTVAQLAVWPWLRMMQWQQGRHPLPELVAVACLVASHQQQSGGRLTSSFSTYVAAWGWGQGTA